MRCFWLQEQQEHAVADECNTLGQRVTPGSLVERVCKRRGSRHTEWQTGPQTIKHILPAKERLWLRTARDKNWKSPGRLFKS
jgi:hypothetical protein